MTFIILAFFKLGFDISAFLCPSVSTLHVAISETPKWSLSGLTPSLPVTKCCDHILMHKVLSRFHISQIRNTSWFVSFVSPYCDSWNSDTELNQRSRYELVSTATIGSRYRISQNRDSCCVCFFPSWYRDSWNSDTTYNQRSRFVLDSMAAIESRYHISRFRHSCCQVFSSLQSPDPRYSMKKINGPDHFLT